MKELREIVKKTSAAYAKNPVKMNGASRRKFKHRKTGRIYEALEHHIPSRSYVIRLDDNSGLHPSFWISEEDLNKEYKAMPIVAPTVANLHGEQELTGEDESIYSTTNIREILDSQNLYCSCSNPNLKTNIAYGSTFEFCKTCRKEKI
jgi:hypothetical protein